MVLKGARQVGKTWLMKEFGQSQYDSYVYFNFDEEDELKSIDTPDAGVIVAPSEMEILGLKLVRFVPGGMNSFMVCFTVSMVPSFPLIVNDNSSTSAFKSTVSRSSSVQAVKLNTINNTAKI